jgi:hypothetical protein
MDAAAGGIAGLGGAATRHPITNTKADGVATVNAAQSREDVVGQELIVSRLAALLMEDADEVHDYLVRTLARIAY